MRTNEALHCDGCARSWHILLHHCRDQTAEKSEQDLAKTCFEIIHIFLLAQERRQKALERRAADAYAEQNQTDKRIEDETDDERDELEEDIVVTKL